MKIGRIFSLLSAAIRGDRGSNMTREQALHLQRRATGARSLKFGSGRAVFDPTTNRVIKAMNRGESEVRGVKSHRHYYFVPAWKRDGFADEEKYLKHQAEHGLSKRIAGLGLA